MDDLKIIYKFDTKFKNILSTFWLLLEKVLLFHWFLLILIFAAFLFWPVAPCLRPRDRALALPAVGPGHGLAQLLAMMERLLSSVLATWWFINLCLQATLRRDSRRIASKVNFKLAEFFFMSILFLLFINYYGKLSTSSTTKLLLAGCVAPITVI